MSEWDSLRKSPEKFNKYLYLSELFKEGILKDMQSDMWYSLEKRVGHILNIKMRYSSISQTLDFVLEETKEKMDNEEEK